MLERITASDKIERLWLKGKSIRRPYAKSGVLIIVINRFPFFDIQADRELRSRLFFNQDIRPSADIEPVRFLSDIFENQLGQNLPTEFIAGELSFGLFDQSFELAQIILGLLNSVR
ncbi:MAG: hypothetical protein V3W18_03650 [candidate division Zixibacteria bacterium]